MSHPDAPLAVLLLAWDDADPAPAALGTALPPGAPLQAALAAQLRLTAILPQHPAPSLVPPSGSPAAPPVTEDPAQSVAPRPLGATAEAAPHPAVGETAPATPGLDGAAVRAVPASLPPLTASTAAPVSTAAIAAPTAAAVAAGAPAVGAPVALPTPGAPVLISLADWTLAELMAEARRRGAPASALHTAGPWRVPAAPYVGREASGGPTPLSSANPAALLLAGSADAVAPGPGQPALTRPTAPAEPAATALPPPAPPSLAPAAPAPSTDAADFAPPVGPGPAEAGNPAPNELDDLRPAESPPPEAARPAALAALRRPVKAAAASPAEPAALPGLAPGAAGAPAEVLAAAVAAQAAALSFRVIQYARFATQLTAGGAGFAVIVAVAWPTWLAAAEIRQRTGRPLVLYVAGLPTERAPRPVRGWLRELERQVLLRADLILVPTPGLARQLGEKYALRRPAQVLSEPLPAALAPESGVDFQPIVDALLSQVGAGAGGAA